VVAHVGGQGPILQNSISAKNFSWNFCPQILDKVPTKNNLRNKPTVMNNNNNE
jgi:hypothetical protein